MQCVLPANWGGIALQGATLQGRPQAHPRCLSGQWELLESTFLNPNGNWWNPQHFVAPAHCPDLPWVEAISELPFTSLSSNVFSSEVSTLVFGLLSCFGLNEALMSHDFLKVWKRTLGQKKEKAVRKKMYMEMSVVLSRITLLELFSVTTNKINVTPMSFLLANHYPHLSLSREHIRV